MGALPWIFAVVFSLPMSGLKELLLSTGDLEVQDTQIITKGHIDSAFAGTLYSRAEVTCETQEKKQKARENGSKEHTAISARTASGEEESEPKLCISTALLRLNPWKRADSCQVLLTVVFKC